MHGRLTVQWGRAQEHAVLAVLLAQAGRHIPIQTLVRQAWPEERRPQNPGATLHTYANRVRATLQDSDTNARLDNTGGGYQLSVDRKSIDYFRLSELITSAHQAAREHDHERIRSLLEGALPLWRDIPLAEVHTEWAENWRNSVVSDEWIPANGLLIDAYIGLEKYDPALRRLNDLQREHGLIVSLARRRLTLLHKLRRHNDANEYYLAARRKLLDDGDHQGAEELRHFQDSFPQPEPPPTATWLPSPRREPNVPLLLRRLPRDVTDFTGREGLLTSLDQLTGANEGPPRPAVIALVGAAGVGKTATAVKWTHRTSARHALGTFFIDLHGDGTAPRVDVAEVIDTLLDALGYPVNFITGPAGRETKLRSLLAEHPMLIVLDNAADSAHVRPLLTALAECVVLITSRRRLTALSVRHDVRNLTLTTLPLTDSTDFLVRRIGARTAREPEAVAQLARIADGLPLALTLIAERAANRAGTTLTTLVRQLRDPDILLHIGDDGDGTDASLNSAFSLAYRALTPAGARVFRLLGIHPEAEISVEALSAMAAATRLETQRALDALVSAHLVFQPADIDRYRVHDLLHRYAAILVRDDQEFATAQRRMLSYYLHSADAARRTAFPHRQGPPLPAIEPGCVPHRFDDASEALRWSLLERSNLVSAIFYAAHEGLHGYGWRLPHCLIDALKRYGLYEDGISTMTVAISSAVADGNIHAEASSLNDLGEIHLITGADDLADRYLNQALELARRHRMEMGEVTVMLNVARRHQYAGRLPEAVTIYRECLRLAGSIGDQERRAVAAHRLGDALIELDLHYDALPYYRLALDLRRKANDVTGTVATHTALVDLFTTLGQLDAAESHQRPAYELLEHVRGLTAAMRLYTVMGELAHARRQDRDALRYAQHAIELAERANHVNGRARALVALGRILADRGNREDARWVWRQAAELYRDTGRERKATKLDALVAEIDGPDPVVPLARSGDEDTVALPAPPRPLGRRTHRKE
ncbi:tetratricopeptide repeat protein [Amycolatopsis pittospori]|uniref:tetratricopeptide repeat protein n=1 Tax=Amycolatopsis pittospori TaxID=2749434 RepID=UPI0015F0A516|nr:tetratricopeptide repeat protein [Amycolatopsis pittospori]